MATALAAVGRIIVPYTVDGLTHRFAAYVRNPLVVGSTYNVNTRAEDENDLDWVDAHDGLVETISYLMPATGFSFGLGELQTRVVGSAIWTTVATHTQTATSHAAGTYVKGEQCTFVQRDVSLKRVRHVVMEGAHVIPFHANYLGALNSNSAGFCEQFTPDYTVDNPPYVWCVGRSNQYMNVSGFVGFTAALNRKIRRRRGLA